MNSQVPTRSFCWKRTRRRGTLVRFQGMAPATEGAGKTKAPEAWLDLRSRAPLGTPSAWLFLVRLHACRAGLRFTRHTNVVCICLPSNQRRPGVRAGTFSLFLKGDR
jgi:hypothetical protein